MSDRLAQLDAYFKANVFDGTRCICSSFSECRASDQGGFYEAQLCHVGAHYDLVREGKPLRVMIVGQEYGHPPACVSLEDRRRMIAGRSGLGRRFKAEPGFMARNPHMKGCTNVLRLIFGLGLGADHESEFIDVAGERVHIFECFALVNFLLCPPSPEPRSWDRIVSLGSRAARRRRCGRIAPSTSGPHLRSSNRRW